MCLQTDIKTVKNIQNKTIKEKILAFENKI